MAVVVNTDNNLSILNISNCNFFNHIPQHSEQNSGEFVIYSSDGYLGLDSISIHSNQATALVLHGGQAIFSGSSVISNNTAVIGAAGLEIRNAMIILTTNSNLIITNNSAQQKGGGIKIYDYTPCGYNYDDCFFQCRPCCNCNLTISGNHALEGGDNILNFGYFSGCDGAMYVPENNINQLSSISSDPRKICFNDFKFECGSKKTVAVYPGQRVTVSIRVLGLQNGSVAGTVLAAPMGSVGILDSEKTQEVGLSGSYVTYTVYLTQEYTIIPYNSILLQPDRDCSYYTVVVNISFRNCPFGFNNMKNNRGMFECQCSLNSVLSNYSIDSQTITKKRHSWIGMFQLNNHSYLAAMITVHLIIASLIFKISSHTLMALIKTSSVNTTGLGYSVVLAQRGGAWYWEALNVVRSALTCGCSYCCPLLWLGCCL